MAVDKNTTDLILGTYRNMFKELQEKNASGESFDKLKKILDEMENMALTSKDVMEYTTKLTTQNYFVDFSNAYSAVLIEMSKSGSGGSSDDILLKQTLSAYENAIQQLEGKPYSDLLIPPIKNIVELGKSGISYPVFLRICEEKGLNKALEGNYVTREVKLSEIEFAEKMFLPVEVKMHKEILSVFDEMSSKAQFGIPDMFEFGLKRQHIEWKYAPEIEKWKMIIRHWEKLLEYMNDWIDSFCEFAPRDTRWTDMRGIFYTKRNIKRTQDCNPGVFKQRERIFQECFGLGWENIFSHDTFLTEVKAGRVPHSEESLKILQEGYQYCKPFSKPEENIIKRAEAEYYRRYGKK
ncbi:MAG: hypothetical protein FJ216_00225 [Ignavibacteria bacterium]|nr:hypothetical protein [Ignavibacteria bacterium]